MNEGNGRPENQESGIDRIILKISTSLGKIPEKMIARRWLYLSLILGIVTVLCIGLYKFRIEESFEDFFSKDNHSAEDYRLFRNQFGSDESIVLLYKAPKGDIFSTESLQKVKNFEDKVNAERLDPKSPLNRITRVRSIISADYLETSGSTMVSRKFIGDNIPQNEAQVKKIKDLALAQKDFPGTFFSKDLRYGLITFNTDFRTRLAKSNEDNKAKKESQGKQKAKAEFDFESFDEPSQSNSPSQTAQSSSGKEVKYEELQPSDYSPTVNELRKILKDQGWAPIYHQYGVSVEPEAGKYSYAMAGNPWMQQFVDVLMKIDLGILMLASGAITFLMLLISFRSFSAMVWPFLIIFLSELATFGLSSYFGIPGSSMMSIIIFLILTLGVASSVHILSGFKIFTLEGAGKMEALKTAYSKSGFSIILAALTTMGGLSALAVMPLIPIRNFGITASMGILIALLLTLFLLPILLSIWSPYKKVSKANLETNAVEKWFQKILDRINSTVSSHPVAIIVIFAIVAVIGLSGINRIKIDTSFAKMAKAGNGITETFNLIDRFFGGASSVEVMVDTGKTEGVRNMDVLNHMDLFTQRVLKEKPDFVPRAFSLVNAVKDSNRLLNDGSNRYYQIPNNNNKLGQVLVMYDSADPKSRRLMVDDDWRTARISMQVTTKSSYEYNKFMNDINHWIAQYFNPLKKNYPDLKVTVTGSIPLMMSVVDYISFSQIRSFVFALMVVSLILFLIYGSVRFGIIAMIPNLVPMTTIVGLAGWLGLEFDTDTLIVMPLAIGIVVDDTIHFLTHYRAELAKGKTARQAVEMSIKEVGQAMMFTSIILAGGFLIFLASVYIPFTKFGILSGGAIASALFADLFLTPALLLTFYPENARIKEAQKNKWVKKLEMVAITVIFLVLAFFLASPAEANPALKESQKAREIMSKAINRDDGRSSYNETVMITCSFKENHGKRSCSSKPRKKEFEAVANDTGKNGKDSISISILTAPASEKNMAFLQKDYNDENKDSDQWMYLPAMKKMKRIVAESENGPKTGTIFGSEFAYEDIEKTKLSDYDYSLLREETMEGKKVWVIESYPKAKRLSKTSYSKAVNWIAQDSLISLKTELYDKQNNLKKTIYSRRLEKHSGVWMARQIIVVNHQNKRMSLMKISKLAVNIKIDESIYTIRALEETGYRERILSPIRKQAQ